MRIAVLCMVLCFPFFVNGQLVFPSTKLKLNSQEDIRLYLVENHGTLKATKDIRLQLVFQNQTKQSVHYRYQILYKEISVFNSFVTIQLNHHHEVLRVKYECSRLEKLNTYNPAPDFEKWSKVHPEELIKQQPQFFRWLQTSSLQIRLGDRAPQLVLVAQAWSKTYDQTMVFDDQGDIVEQYNHERNWMSDTLVQGRVFNPDPLTSLSVNYGGIYVDSNDIHQTWMNAAYETKDIRANYANGLFYLENDLVTLDEFEGPNIPPVTQTNPSFLFNRNESGFEDCNVLYHITHFHDYISSLGYDSLMINGVLVDAHAQNGVDNSVFSRNGGNPTLRYGVGGVDDGEDADVIIHEYAHGLSWSANGNDNFTDARQGLDEGLADYFATSYSRTINPFQWQQVFSWDGHNSFWSGRTANTTNTYPLPIGQIYATGEVWNTAMSAIWTDLGGIITDKLMLEAMYSFTNSTGLAEAALYILQADSLLFGGQHQSIICMRFQQKNILDANCEPVTTQRITTPSWPYSLINSQGFAEGSGDVVVAWNEPCSGRYIVSNSVGAVLMNENFNLSKQIKISPLGLSSGLYYLTLVREQQRQTIKLCRY